jgi:transcriptional regulator with XRE-family HTH domain
LIEGRAGHIANPPLTTPSSGMVWWFPLVPRLGLELERAHMSRLERELENPTVGLLDRLANALSAHISELFIEPKTREPRPRPLPGGRHSQKLGRKKKP